MLKIKYNFDISTVSYIRVGGRVKLYIETDELEIIKKILRITKKVKYIGNTSNIFFSFKYYDYIFIKYINKTFIIGNYLTLGSSVSLKYLVNVLIEKGIGGFEKLEGIPGLIGGSIINNASSYKQDISELLESIKILTKFGEIKKVKKEEIIFTYHSSSLKDSNSLIIEANFKIQNQDKNILLESKNRVHKLRIISQPHDKLTLGSTFKHYENICIPRILESINVKGMKKANSIFSYKHSNFIEIGKKEKIENIIYLIEEVNRLLYNKLGYYIDLEIEKIRGKR